MRHVESMLLEQILLNDWGAFASSLFPYCGLPPTIVERGLKAMRTVFGKVDFLDVTYIQQIILLHLGKHARAHKIRTVNQSVSLKSVGWVLQSDFSSNRFFTVMSATLSRKPSAVLRMAHRGISGLNTGLAVFWTLLCLLSTWPFLVMSFAIDTLSKAVSLSLRLGSCLSSFNNCPRNTDVEFSLTGWRLGYSCFFRISLQSVRFPPERL